uniref:Uncharacterized protein n=1 Tax=Rhizophagus irregularis (strain DAOM 181602 / DAOM 197198 / MUCL 43194) TaxID=747089 RepID=U9SNH7_RHIID
MIYKISVQHVHDGPIGPCPICLVCITCAESENNRICAPKTLIKNQEDLFEPITKNVYIKYKKAIDYAFLHGLKLIINKYETKTTKKQI